MLTRLAEMEGFKGGFLGGSGIAARINSALPNTSIQTVQEVIDYEVEIMSNTDLPFVADGESGGRQPNCDFTCATASSSSAAARPAS